MAKGGEEWYQVQVSLLWGATHRLRRSGTGFALLSSLAAILAAAPLAPADTRTPLAWAVPPDLSPQSAAKPEDGRGNSTGVVGLGFDLSWWTIDGGGGPMSTGGLTLDGTLGQPDAGAWGGGGYALDGGFWNVSQLTIFRDGFEIGDDSRWSAVVGGTP